MSPVVDPTLCAQSFTHSLSHSLHRSICFLTTNASFLTLALSKKTLSDMLCFKLLMAIQ